jgi:predicted Fe-Mo cluster-binding NifX family protein
MKICLPVDQLNGLASEISPSFRAAPVLMLIDSVSHEFLGIDASSGACGATPTHVDAIVCAGGIGRGLFNGLRSRGIRVFNTDALTVAEALSELSAGSLEEVAEVACCSDGDHDHAEGQGCGCSSQQAESSGCGCGHH